MSLNNSRTEKCYRWCNQPSFVMFLQDIVDHAFHNFLSFVALKNFCPFVALLKLVSPSIYTSLLDSVLIVFLLPSNIPASIKFSKTSFHIMCPRNFNSVFRILSICLYFVSISLKRCGCSYVRSMVFSASTRRIYLRSFKYLLYLWGDCPALTVELISHNSSVFLFENCLFLNTLFNSSPPTLVVFHSFLCLHFPFRASCVVCATSHR